MFKIEVHFDRALYIHESCLGCQHVQLLCGISPNGHLCHRDVQIEQETLHLIATLEEDWARINAFGAKISALNLLLHVANYLYRQLLHFTDGFKDLYSRIQHLHKEISKELNQNQSRVVLYDQAWFHSVSATYYQLASNTATTQEEKDRMYALSQRSLQCILEPLQ